MGLNLGDAKDFASATLSNISGVLNLLTGLNQHLWDVQESGYGHAANIVKFHTFDSAPGYNGAISDVQDIVSRRIVPFKYPYVDGQTTDDLGRDGESFEFNIILYGMNYYEAYVNLLREFNDPHPGTLIHPIRGPITCKFKGATITHKSQERQAVTLRATFYEHNFEVSFQAPKQNTKSALATAIGFIGKIANILNKINSNISAFNAIKNQLFAKTNAYQAAYTKSLVQINTTFNNGSSTDIPGLLPVNSGSSEAFPVAESPNDPLSAITPEEIAAQQSPVLASLQAIDVVKAVRNQATDLIVSLEVTNNGLGALDFYDEILDIKNSQIALQSALELGLQSSNATIKPYRVPRLMSIREVCFANGLSPDRSFELEQLNPDLLSMNFIERDTIVQVPTG